MKRPNLEGADKVCDELIALHSPRKDDKNENNWSEAMVDICSAYKWVIRYAQYLEGKITQLKEKSEKEGFEFTEDDFQL